MSTITHSSENLVKKENIIPQPLINDKQLKIETSENQEKQKDKKKGRAPFASNEDEMLKRLVQMYGTKQWRLISSMMPSRTAKQCRDRYTNYLAPGYFRGEWSNNEDMLLMELYSIHGPKWSTMKNFFPNRSSNSIKNRWTYFLSRRYQEKQLNPQRFGYENIHKNDNIELTRSLFDSSQKDEMLLDEKFNDMYASNLNINNTKEIRNDDVMTSPFEKATSFFQLDTDLINCFENAFEWNF